MKKIKMLICLCLIAFLLSGCGNRQEETTTLLMSTTIRNSVVTTKKAQTTQNTTSATATEAVEATTVQAETTTAESATTTTQERTTKAETTKSEKKKTKTTKAQTAKATKTTKPATTKPKANKPTTTKAEVTQDVTTAPIVTTTEPVTTKPSTTKTPVTTNTEKPVESCSVKIVCSTVIDNLDKLQEAKRGFVPSGGIILKQTQIEIKDGETVFDVIRRACNENVCIDNCTYCQKNAIQFEYVYTPAFETYYIEGIHQIYEKDCGSMSGWMYSVNGEFPNMGSSSYTVSSGDEIVFSYTCNMGADIGNSN